MDFSVFKANFVVLQVRCMPLSRNKKFLLDFLLKTLCVFFSVESNGMFVLVVWPLAILFVALFPPRLEEGLFYVF